ncbi:MAG: short-chain dehydrogenase [Oceanospirillaceae bacterium]|nr:short-chain dehydrogenase [Oceanospirillaceae bacterium]
MNTHPLFDLTGKGALLTGATAGMGLAMARALGQAGARVAICGLDADETDSAVHALLGEGIVVHSFTCDVGDRPQVERLYRVALAALGQIDILICNAGFAPPPGSLLDIDDEQWLRTQRINLQSPHWLTSLAIPAMAERRDGVVILTASLSSVRGNKALGLYGITKAGVAQLARNLAVEWGPHNVRVNAISPGVIRTRFAGPMLDNPALMEKRMALTPLRRVGEPEEIAGVVLMLASRAGGFITGQNLIVDGGTTISDGN